MSEPDNNAVTQIESDPLGSWKFVSSLIISGVTVMLCIKNGWEVFYAVLLFFPVRRMVKAIINNNSCKFFAGISTLILFPVLTGSENIIQNAVRNAVNIPGTGDKGYAVIAGMVLTVLFSVIMLISSLIGKALPEIRLPKAVYKKTLIVIFSLNWFMAMIALYCGIAFCNGRFIRLPGIINFLLPGILAAISISALKKMIRNVNEFADKNTADRQKVPVSAGKEANASGGETGKLEERPKTKLADVAGMDEVKKQIRLRLIEPVKNPKLAEKYGLKTGGGVLLYGPPGTGKTFIARAVAGELDLPFYMITAADVFGKYVGESEKNIRELFANARKNPLSVVFIDELEVLFGKRTENIHETTQKVISVILQELDGVSQNKNPMLLLGATNTPWKVDEAFLRPGRFDILAFVDLPDIEARKQILKSAFKQGKLPLEEGLIDYIAENSKRYSGADLNGVVMKMRQDAYDSKAEMYSLDMAYEILLKTTPTSTGDLLRQIKQWEKERRA
ncbi:MAG: ATP-binding protein [Lentisphaerae bacterium]|nr:ATP-binding protein [Lentisphaerota bacterium]